MAISTCLKKIVYISNNKTWTPTAVLWWWSSDDVESPGIIPGQFLNKPYNDVIKRRQVLPICTVVALVVSIELR